MNARRAGVPSGGCARRNHPGVGAVSFGFTRRLDKTREVVRAVNAAVGMLYWQVGNRSRREVLREKHAAYGEKIAATQSRN